MDFLLCQSVNLIKIILNIKFILLSNALKNSFAPKSGGVGFSSCCTTPKNLENRMYSWQVYFIRPITLEVLKNGNLAWPNINLQEKQQLSSPCDMTGRLVWGPGEQAVTSWGPGTLSNAVIGLDLIRYTESPRQLKARPCPGRLNWSIWRCAWALMLSKNLFNLLCDPNSSTILYPFLIWGLLFGSCLVSVGRNPHIRSHSEMRDRCGEIKAGVITAKLVKIGGHRDAVWDGGMVSISHGSTATHKSLFR